MRETAFGFEYSWADLKPVRALTVVVTAGQVIGAVAGLVYPRFPSAFESLWFGAALACLPACLVGLVVQALDKPGSLGANRVMVWRVVLISALFTGFGAAMPYLGFGAPD